MESIEKLREKVAKDPSSKLFVPLAEEYRKAGKLDEAIAALKTGLQRQPGYMSARVALGKIYLEKHMLAEAKDELEKVVKSIPDNLFAQRKLADIYKQLGDIPKAIAQFKTVLRLNPFDEEALGILKDLESGGSSESLAEPEPTTESMLEATSFAGQEADEELATFETGGRISPIEELAALPPEEEPPFALPEELARLAEEPVIAVPEPEEEEAGVFTIEAPEEAVAEDISFEGIPEEEAVYTLSEEEAPSVEGLTVPIEGLTSPIEVEANEESMTPDELSAFGSGFAYKEEESEQAAMPVEEAVPVEETAPEFEIPEEGLISPAEELLSTEDISFEIPEEGLAGPEEAIVAEELMALAEPEEAPSKTERPTMTALSALSDGIALSDSQVGRGDYALALKTLGALSRENPGDRTVMQRMHELKGLIKLLGMENEIVVARLDGFLDAVKERENEFFGIS